jgi:hypothetical protein
MKQILLLLLLPLFLPAQTQLTNAQADSLANDKSFQNRVKISMVKEATLVLTGTDTARIYARAYLKSFAGAIALEPSNDYFLKAFTYAIVARRKTEPLTDAQIDKFCRKFFDDLGTEFIVSRGQTRPAVKSKAAEEIEFPPIGIESPNITSDRKHKRKQ